VVLGGSNIGSSVLGYKSCMPSNDWYVSQPTTRCSASFATMGFAPDPKDCSKYYACDSYIGPDGMSAGEIILKNIFFFLFIKFFIQVFQCNV
jgi:hypothetical protein